MTQVGSLRFTLQQSDLLRAAATARQFDPHLHSTYSLVALRGGEAEVQSDRWSGIVRAGDLFFFNPYEVHSARCLTGAADYVTLYISEQMLGECLTFNCRQGTPLIETSVLQQNSQSAGFINALVMSSKGDASLQACLRDILRTCDWSAPPPRGTKLAARATLLIQSNATRAMRTEDLARQLGVHQSHLIRSFSGAVGLTPQTYIRQVRVAKARDLICSGMSLSEVALMLEFSDQAHLTREFKKVFGVPPGVLSRTVRSSPTH